MRKRNGDIWGILGGWGEKSGFVGGVGGGGRGWRTEPLYL